MPIESRTRARPKEVEERQTKMRQLIRDFVDSQTDHRPEDVRGIEQGWQRLLAAIKGIPSETVPSHVNLLPEDVDTAKLKEGLMAFIRKRSIQPSWNMAVQLSLIYGYGLQDGTPRSSREVASILGYKGISNVSIRNATLLMYIQLAGQKPYPYRTESDQSTGTEVITPITIGPEYTDIFGHVNYKRFPDIFEAGQDDLMGRCVQGGFHGVGSTYGVRKFVKKIETTISGQLLAGDQVLQHTWIGKIGTTSITFNQRMERDGQDVADQTIVVVMVKMGDKPFSVPQDLRVKLQPYLIETPKQQ